MKKLLLALLFLLIPINALFATDYETEKIQWHLDRVETILRKVDTSFLTSEQKINRLKMLDRLHLYTEAWKFPNNDTFTGKSVPFFRWSNGNLCAVWYLMDGDIEYKSFIENIVKTNNNFEIIDAQDNPIINAWAKKYGFSIIELAMIQPTYGAKTLEWCTFEPPGINWYHYSYQYWCWDVKENFIPNSFLIIISLIVIISLIGVILFKIFMMMYLKIFKGSKIWFLNIWIYVLILFFVLMAFWIIVKYYFYTSWN